MRRFEQDKQISKVVVRGTVLTTYSVVDTHGANKYSVFAKQSYALLSAMLWCPHANNLRDYTAHMGTVH